MRQHLVALLFLAPVAHAEPKSKPLDVSDAIGNVDVYRDEPGKLYVIPRDAGETGDTAKKWTFYGDGQRLHLQRVVTFSVVGGAVTIGTWSPRVRGIQFAMIERTEDGTASIICSRVARKLDRRPLTLVPSDKATKLLQTARFEPPLWERRVLYFGRGDGATYYLVDALRDEYGGNGHRLFIGKKGQMKHIAVTDFAKDTGGTAVTTKVGELAIGPGDKSAMWKHGKKKLTIERLDAGQNGYLIYRELGVYGQLGTICEDQ